MAEQGREDELADAWRAAVAAAGVDPEDPWNTVGVSYNGPDREWLWTAWVQRSNAKPSLVGPEGQGRDPIEALRSLIDALERRVNDWSPAERASRQR